MLLQHAADLETLDRQCEKFTGGPTQASERRLHVTINKKGIIFVNRKAYGMMGRPIAVYLHFNRVKDMIVIEPTQAVTSNQAFASNRRAGIQDISFTQTLSAGISASAPKQC